jgi:hypothetical protein
MTRPVGPGDPARPRQRFQVAGRGPRPDLRADPALPADTRLWAALQHASGGAWRGSVYDVERIVRALEAGMRASETEGD